MDRSFTTAAHAHIVVPTMHARQSLAYVDASDARMVMLPYRGDTADFLVVLPKEKTLTELQASMTPETIEGWVDAAQPAMIQLSLPKFEVHATYSSLEQPLAALGVTDAFHPHADFSGISDESLMIGVAVHKAFILVDETSTEAAAATAITAVYVSGRRPPPSIEFHANEPFWFAVRDRATGTLLFTGQVADPSAGD
jgi:serpin B